MEFESRASVVNDVLEALKDEKVRICSLCGMGGTGKTTLAKKIIQRVEDDHLFDKVAMVTVSQNPQPVKIRGDIVSSLRWDFKSEELETSDKLIASIMNSDQRILFILDDIWEELDFEAIGLPKSRSKILLTSRKKDVCQRMGSEPNFVINVLTGGEAWGLFKGIAVETIEKLRVHETAKNIANECGGLPIIIVTLAVALKYEVKATWNDSLLNLQKSNLLGISELEKVYSRIQLSYDLLNDREAQACFRLCSLFPEDHNVEVECLVWFGKGLQLFENVESIKETRDRVESKIDKLKKSFLLLDGKRDGYVKMHDILRDFAISISPYIVGFEKVMEKWPETNQYENCSAISFVCDKINEHPLELRCPKLELLQVLLHNDCQVGIPNGFFEGLKELKVLVLKVPPLSQSLATLKKLRTLIIGETERWERIVRVNNIGNLLGDLENLEILVISRCKPCDDFPVEIGVLCNLRMLKFSNVEFEYMPPGVLSKLVKLEELELSDKYYRWGCKDVRGRERFNAGLDEIESLPLTTLKICVPKGSILAEKLVNNLTKFVVHVGRKYLSSAYFTYDNANAKSEVYGVDATDVIVNWMNVWLRKCERFRWKEVGNAKNILSLQSSEDNVFLLWKEINIELCHEMQYLVDTIAERIPSYFFSQLEVLRLFSVHSLTEICPFSKIEAPCFSKLSRIDISYCYKLKHLFPLSVARDLRLLQTIEIQDCREIGEIFYEVDGVDDAHDDQVASSSSTVQLTTNPTVEMTTSATPTILNSNNHVDDKEKLVSCCPCLRGRSEKHPEFVSTQPIMEENIAKVENKEVDHSIIFPQLKTLNLLYARELRILYAGNHAIELPSLENFAISDCKKMEALSYGSFNAPRLKQIQINCTEYPAEGVDLNAIVKKFASGRSETEYWVDPRTEHFPSSFFSQLKTLTLCNMEGLREVCPFSKIEAPICFTNLSKIDIHYCPKLKHVFPLSVAPKLTQLQSIVIDHCEEMEEIFYRDQVGDSNQVVLSVQLTTKIEAPRFSNLSEVQIYYCHKLKHVFPLSVARNLRQLQSIKLRDCQEIGEVFYNDEADDAHDQIVEENIAKVDEKEVDHSIIVFPQLRTLELESLQKLRILYDGNHAIELPSLEKLDIWKCGKMEGLFYGSINAPKLKEKKTYVRHQAIEGGDLNANVKQFAHQRIRIG